MILVRTADVRDVPAIREIFLAVYGTDYSPEYYDEQQLTRLVYSDHVLLLVAEDTTSGRLLGTASVDLEFGAQSDLVGEFGRLAVHPDARHAGIGSLLMRERLARVADRIQLGLVEARVAHPYSVRIAESNRFVPVGFLPDVWRLHGRESLLILAQYFDSTLQLRRNHPRVVPEIHSLAHLALHNCGLVPDAIVDEDAPAYAADRSFALEDLTTEGYAALLRIERGRVRHREIFGPMRLHYGIFKLTARQSTYVIAREDGAVVGAAGFTVSPLDRTVRIFELISLDDGVIGVLLQSLQQRWEAKLQGAAAAVTVDVSAYSPRMQRTLLELGFMPVAYVPAFAFHEVERLDVIQMMKLATPPSAATADLPPASRAVAELVLRRFQSRLVLPRIAQAVHRLPLFAGLSAEQVARLAGVCRVARFGPGDELFLEQGSDRRMHVVLEGLVDVSVGALPVGLLLAGDCAGETSLLTGAPHSVTARARGEVETAVLDHGDLAELIRLRPDIGLCLYRNLAIGVSEKLKRLNAGRGIGGRPDAATLG